MRLKGIGRLDAVTESILSKVPSRKAKKSPEDDTIIHIYSHWPWDPCVRRPSCVTFRMRLRYLRVHLRLFHTAGVTLHILDVTPYALRLRLSSHYLCTHLRDLPIRSRGCGRKALALSWIFRSPLNLNESAGDSLIARPACLKI